MMSWREMKGTSAIMTSREIKVTRSTVVVGVLFTCSMLLGAQAGAQVEFGVGPIGGVNFGTTSIGTTNGYATGLTPMERTGLMVGAQAEVGLTKAFFVVVQPMYIQKGYRLSETSGSAVLAIEEIEVPLLVKVKFLDGVFRPYVFAGPNLSIVLSAVQSYAYTGHPGYSDDYTRNTSSTDVALDVGCGTEFNWSPEVGIVGDVRYSSGLKSIMKLIPARRGMRPTKTSGLQVLVGVKFHVM